MSAIFGLISSFGLCWMFAEFTDPRFLSAPEHSDNVFKSFIWFGFWIICAINMYIFEHSNRQSSADSQSDIESDGEWWTTAHEKTNPRDAMAESNADWSNYWDEDGNRHLYLSYTRGSGQEIILEDKIVRYGEIKPWGSKAEE